MSHLGLKFFCVTVIVSLLVPFVPRSDAAANYQINYQGKLTDANGSPITSSVNMVFKLYTASSGGTALWTETRSGANTVTVNEGIFSVMLGSVTSLSSVNFDQTLYLGVTVGSDSEMTPRKILGAVPAAFVADKLDGLTSAQFLRTDAANATTTTSTFLTITQSGTGAIVDFQDGSNSALKILDGGNVGVGTSTPNWSLQVASSTPYFALTDTDAGTNAKHWLISAVDGNLKIGTSTDALSATSTYLTITNTGSVGIATTSPASTLTVTGSACVSGGSGATAACSTTAGTISARTFNTATVDLAENYPTNDPTLTSGEILALDLSAPLLVKRASTSDVLFGIVSTEPGVLLGGAASNLASSIVPVALAGRVPVKVNRENGPITVGDRIALSSVDGMGAKATSTAAATIGVALEPFDDDEPGQIVVFVDLRGAADPVVAMTQAASNFRVDENGKLVVKELHTDKLCLGETCITETELRRIMRRSSVRPTEPEPKVDPDPEPAPGPIPEPEPEDTATTTPVDNSPIDFGEKENGGELTPQEEPGPAEEPAPEPEILAEPTTEAADTPVTE